MAQQEGTLMSKSTGIRPRHARACSRRTDKQAPCRCTPTFEANVYDAKAEKRITKVFPTKSAAMRWREDARVALRSGDLSADRGPMFTDAVEALLERMRAGHVRTRSGEPYKPAAVRGYKSSLYLRAIPAFGHLRLAEVTRRDVQRFIDELVDKGFATATIDSDLTPLRVLFRQAVKREQVRINPMTELDVPAVRCKPRRVVPDADAKAMIAALDAGAERALWATAFYAGLRMGELSALGRAEIDLGAGVIYVRRGWDSAEGYIAPKNRKARKVPIPAVLRDHLDEYLLGTDRDEHIFGVPRWVNRATGRARKRWEDRGLPVVDLHEARHTYASLMIAAGTRQKALSTFMGHATTRITEDLYGHLFPGDEAEAATQLDAYLARQVGGSTVAQTVAHPEETALPSG
jgi:integrase